MMKSVFAVAVLLVAFSVIATSANLQPTQAKIIFDITTRVNSTGNYTYGTNTIISLNQTLECRSDVGYIQSGIFPPANYIWYVNGVAVKSENIGDSIYIFTPKTLGKFTITLTVNGAANSQTIIVTVVSSMPTPTPTAPSTQTPTPTATVPEFSAIALLPFTVIAFAFMVIKQFRKRK
jgi:hypothetical protein